MFTQPAFIRKNTPELRKKLENLGYKCSKIVFEHPYLCIATVTNNECSTYTTITHEMLDTKDPYSTWNCAGRIDCKTNEELFLAIAALRDDSDKYQYFVTEEEMHWLNQNTWMPVGSFIFSYVDNYTDIDGKVHKATIEELILHFKYENKTS